MAQTTTETNPFEAGPIMRLPQARLVQLLEDPTASDFEKAKACQRLAVIGDSRCVPALSALLGNPNLSHYARTALEPMPGHEADAALREALGKLAGDLLIGVVNSIGRCRDPLALEALAKLRREGEPAVAAAAQAALTRLRRP
jgi:HEAT repeat protein